MKLIKLNAIDSTNSFLKDLAQNTILENKTVVTTTEQLKGRGQMGTEWSSEANKNLLCSVFFRFNKLAISHQFYLNFGVALAVFDTLKKYDLPKLAIKWPNDILSEKSKISGILVENVITNRQIQSSIIGIGVNVNQEKFPANLLQVTSMKRQLEKDVSIDQLLVDLVAELSKNIELLEKGAYKTLEKRYLEVLYKKNTPMMFRNRQSTLFMGMIIGVTSYGKLQIQLDDDTIKEFGIKEVSFA
ncbi:biotin--[acetyl-CoA-carboxylase] ligase [Tenacibaculum maritimum]|uniref:biotin--[acetyl-CoA-carboxylase] ligase n=1 Tax=Tenacibaculum maritimum TaxID=107401 RepID=UPI00388F2B8A